MCNGTSEPHLKAIVSEIRAQMREVHGLRPTFADGMPASHWVVLDYGEVLVHAFTPDRRAHYALESLWGDAKRIRHDGGEDRGAKVETRGVRAESREPSEACPSPVAVRRQ